MKRIFEGLAASLAALLLSAALLPVWLFRGCLTATRGGRLAIVPSHSGEDAFSTLALIDRAGKRHHLWLPSVLCGDMTFIGPAVDAPRRGRKPGLVSPSRLRLSVGIGHQGTQSDDDYYFENASIPEQLGLLFRYALSSLYSCETKASCKSVEIFGVRINAMSMQEAVDTLARCRSKPGQGPMKIAAFVNPDCLNKAIGDRDYHHLLNQSDLVLPDGSGLRIAAKVLGVALTDNVNGTDLFPLLCERAAASGQKMFLFGGRPGVALEAAEAMQQRFPGLRIVGCLDGYSHRARNGVVIRAINASGADIVLAGLGAPQQETWLHEHRDNLNAGIGVGVGGLFDYYSGHIRRAPLWLREAGLEWMWRVFQEPGAKWHRYVVGNPLFLWRIARERHIRRHIGRGTRTQRIPLTTTQSVAALNADQAPAARKTNASRRVWQRQLMLHAASKRALDITVAASALIALSPLLLATAVAVPVESPGPLLFRQLRVGQRGKLFSMFKFRSMYVNAEERLAALHSQNESADGVLFKMKHDPRITRIGRFIRRFSIDELPQIINVLRGDMSIVGPRPALPGEVDRYAAADRKRLQTKPGLTCLWQIGGRSELSFEQQVELDIDYLRKQNLLTDIRIIAKTVPAVLGGKGAY